MATNLSLSGPRNIQKRRPQSGFINGDPTAWKTHASHRADVTIFGAFGGTEKGWNQVGPRNGSKQFKPSRATQKIEYLHTVPGTTPRVSPLGRIRGRASAGVNSEPLSRSLLRRNLKLQLLGAPWAGDSA
jgi:hypothetical protein